MSVGSISFWQQNQNYWARASQDSQQQAQTDAVISSMFGASTTLSAGLASIANQTALSRVNSQLTAAVQSALGSINGGSAGASTTGTSSSTNSSSASSSSGGSSTPSSPASSSSPSTTGAPATGTGSVPLAASTSLFTLGILAGGAITVNDGTNTTTYKSTGSDTVGDLLNAINTNAHGNAQVTAWLDSTGKLVVTANKQTSTISIGGAFAPNVGFGASNDLFQPTAAAPAPTSGGSGSSPASSSSGTSSSASTPTSSSSSSASGSSASAAATLLRNSALALQSSGTAEVLLASSGLSGSSIVNLLA